MSVRRKPFWLLALSYAAAMQVAGCVAPLNLSDATASASDALTTFIADFAREVIAAWVL